MVSTDISNIGHPRQSIYFSQAFLSCQTQDLSQTAAETLMTGTYWSITVKSSRKNLKYISKPLKLLLCWVGLAFSFNSSVLKALTSQWRKLVSGWKQLSPFYMKKKHTHNTLEEFYPWKRITFHRKKTFVFFLFLSFLPWHFINKYLASCMPFLNAYLLWCLSAGT